MEKVTKEAKPTVKKEFFEENKLEGHKRVLTAEGWKRRLAREEKAARKKG